MTELATITQVTNVVLEATKGTRPLGGGQKRYLGLALTPQQQLTLNAIRAQGYKFPAAMAAGQNWCNAALPEAPCYNALAVILSSLLGTPTPAQQGATAAYKHDFTPDSDGADTTSSWYIEHGDATRAQGMPYGLVTEWGIEITRDGVTQSGSMIGQAMTDNIGLGKCEVQTLTITGTPTGGTFTITFDGETTAAIDYDATAAAVEAALEAIASIGAGNVSCTGGPLPGTAVVIEFVGDLAGANQALATTTDSLTGGTDPESTIAETLAGGAVTEVAVAPLLPEDCTIYLDSAYGSLGTTALTRVLSASLNVSGRFGPLWAINASNSSFASHVETEPEFAMGLTAMADSVAMGLLDDALAGTKQFLRLEFVGPVIASTYTYKLTWDMCGTISESGELADSDGVWAKSYTLRATHDADWGKAVDVDLYNIVDAL